MTDLLWMVLSKSNVSLFEEEILNVAYLLPSCRGEAHHPELVELVQSGQPEAGLMTVAFSPHLPPRHCSLHHCVWNVLPQEGQPAPGAAGTGCSLHFHLLNSSSRLVLKGTRRRSWLTFCQTGAAFSSTGLLWGQPEITAASSAPAWGSAWSSALNPHSSRSIAAGS